jgi:signal transduction histidine kinase/CheY-like chemotaxis protein
MVAVGDSERGGTRGRSSPPGGRRRLSISRAEALILSLGLALVTGAVAMTRVAESPNLVRFWDNVHWTAAYGAAALAAWLGRNRVAGVARETKAWFTFALSALFAGQLLWDVQVAVNYNPFPGPCDALFGLVGPLSIVATWRLVHGADRARRAAIVLDALGVSLAVLALILAAYLPRRANTDLLTLTVMVGYPTALLGATGLFLLVLLHLGQAPRRGASLLAGALLAQGLLWMAWNLATLEGRLGDGVLLNYLFSYGTLLFGFAVCAYKPGRDEVSGSLARGYRLVTQALPIVFVVLAALAVALSTTLLPAVRMAIGTCMAGVVIVAIVRQSLLLEDRERLLVAEAQNRAFSERLTQTQRLESLGTLASGIAHDMNNLLTAVLGHAELLTTQPLNEEGQHSVENLRGAAIRARDVVRRILTFSRQDSTRTEPVDCGSLIHEVADLLRAALPARHTTDVTLERDLFVEINPGQLHQVLMNLGTNASHAIGDRSGRIHFQVRGVDLEGKAGSLAPGPYVAIHVSDTGVGMSEATQARIFEPFFTTKPREQGTGLGLSVVFGIVSDSGGSIAVDSKPGHGTTMKLLLPRAVAPAAGATDPNEAATSLPRPSLRAEATPAAAGLEEVMVVDDEAAVGGVLGRLLARKGETAVCVGSPDRAIALVREDPGRFWLVVTDQSMPAMHGTELAEELRRIGYQGRLVLSSGTDFVLSGTPFDDLLPKPYTLAALSALLDRLSGMGDDEVDETGARKVQQR